MCIAAIIREPVSLTYLQSMEDDNPHGGGVACAREGSIFFMKGLTAKAIHALQESGQLSYPYLLHFRWATHGAKTPELAHPFPTGPRALFGETVGFCDQVMMHNGVWSDYAKHLPIQSEIPDAVFEVGSDTTAAAWLAFDNPDILDRVPWATAIATISQESGEMDIVARGTWTEHKGNHYSNLNWLPHGEGGMGKWWEVYSQRSAMLRSAPGQAIAPPVVLTPAPAPAQDCDSATAGKWSPDPMGDDRPEYASWEDYVRRRYGDETAQAAMAVGDPSEYNPQTVEEALRDLNVWSPTDMVSEDYQDVNTYLEVTRGK